MRSTKNNERDMLKCLNELTRCVERMNNLIEKRWGNQDNVVNSVRGDLGNLKERLNNLNIRIGGV